MQVAYQKTSNAQEAFQVVKESLNEDVIKRFNVKGDIKYNEENLSLNVKGKGFKVEMDFLDSYTEVNIELNFFLKPFKGKVMGQIKKLLLKVL